jgi:D-arabinose 1-dehydrogenase-like Zn-dependent alcohol dehydrogenase
MHAYLGHDDRRPAPLILGHEGPGRSSAGRWTAGA